MHGQTTAQEGGLGPGADDIARVRNAIDKKLLPIDLYIVAKDTATDDTINAAYSIASEYNKHPEGTSLKLLAGRPDLDIRHIDRVRLGGIKLWLYGSPDSCWMTKPFAVNPPGKEGAFMGCQQIPPSPAGCCVRQILDDQSANKHAHARSMLPQTRLSGSSKRRCRNRGCATIVPSSSTARISAWTSWPESRP